MIVTIDLTRARELAASAYPEGIRDSMGNVHVPAPRRSILKGLWDNSPLVQQHMPKEAKDA